MAKIPVVGPKQVHAVQLSPKLRAILHKRAAAANRRAYAPVLSADRAAFTIPQSEYETQVGAAKGGASAIEASLAQALAGLQGSGLHGHALQDAINSLKSRQGEALQALPYAFAGAAEERTKGRREDRQQLLEDRADMLKGIGTSFNSLLEGARSSGSEGLKEQEGRERTHNQDVAENHREKAKESTEGTVVSENVQSAYQVALSGYKWLLAHHGEETKAGNEIKPPKAVPEWEEFVKTVAKEAGAGDYKDSLEAVETLRKQLARLQHQGKLPQNGSEAEEG